MAWYLWALVILAAAGLIGFKIWYVPKWMKKQQMKRAQKQRLLEDDER